MKVFRFKRKRTETKRGKDGNVKGNLCNKVRSGTLGKVTCGLSLLNPSMRSLGTNVESRKVGFGELSPAKDFPWRKARVGFL